MLTYRLDVSGANDISASFDNGSLVVRLPKSKAAGWASSGDVSLHAVQKHSGAGSLSLLIEKDFRCLEPGHNRDCTDDEDTFPHPSDPSQIY